MSLDALLRHQLVWRGDRLADAAVPTLPSGYAELDAGLPGGGWPRGQMVEILAAGPGRGELLLILPALARFQGWSFWLAPPLLPYMPELARRGVAAERTAVVAAAGEDEIAWAAEQIARTPEVAALLWRVEDRYLRRLQLAAEQGNGLVFCFRSMAARGRPSPSPLRLAVAMKGRELWVDIFKRRGGVSSHRLRLEAVGEGAWLPAT